MQNIWPLIVFGLQYLYTKLLQHPAFDKFALKVRIAILINYMVFEYLEMGNLHQIVAQNGLASQQLWITLLISFFLNIDKKMLFSKKIMHQMMFKLKFIKDKTFEIKSMEAMYIEIKLEVELFSHLVYAFLLTMKFYMDCVGTVVDCSGRPVVNISPIFSDHYILCIILILSTVVQMILKFFLTFFKVQEVGYNPKLIRVIDYLFYVFALNLICFRYCINSLYVMLSL